jgi:hypothetical protein
MKNVGFLTHRIAESRRVAYPAEVTFFIIL